MSSRPFPPHTQVRKEQVAAEDAAMKAKKQKLESDAAAAMTAGDKAAEGAGGGDTAMTDAAAAEGSTAAAAVAAATTSGGAPRATGHYDLVGVLTHKGRAADSGHYISWVKRDNGDWVRGGQRAPSRYPEFSLNEL